MNHYHVDWNKRIKKSRETKAKRAIKNVFAHVQTPGPKTKRKDKRVVPPNNSKNILFTHTLPQKEGKKSIQ